MSRMSELSAILDEMVECGNHMVQTALKLKDYFSSTEETAPAPVVEKEPESESAPATENKKVYSTEDVRALLAQKAAESEGKFKTVVKDLVKKYAEGGTLKNVAPEKYEALIAELEEVTNA